MGARDVMGFIRNLDLFGYVVNLNFDHFQPTRKTFCGGIVTISLVIFIILLFVSNLLKIGNIDFSRFDLSETQLNL